MPGRSGPLPEEYVRVGVVLRREHAAWLSTWSKSVGSNRSAVCRALVEHFRSLPETMRRMIVATHGGGSGEPVEDGSEPPAQR
jgi:hypothetical protein